MSQSLACIGEPVSWLRLETFAAGKDDRAVRAHVAACSACQQCLEEIRADVVALPRLVLPVSGKRAPKRAWWKPFAPVFALATAAALVLLLVVRRDVPQLSVREEAVMIKGVGEIVLGTVRERAGDIRMDARSFREGDRWKLIVTCPPSASIKLSVTVAEVGTSTLDRPLASASIACGNRVVVPGAFTLSGPRANRVCATITAVGGLVDTACVTIAPER